MDARIQGSKFTASFLVASAALLCGCNGSNSPPPSSPSASEGQTADGTTTHPEGWKTSHGKPVGVPITAPRAVAPIPDKPRVIGYFTNWAHQRPEPCKFSTADVDASLFTHINYAFASIEASEDRETYSTVPSSPEDIPRLYGEVNALKKQNPDLKTFISIGGWAFNDPPTEWIFSAMASTPQRRGSFIRQTIAFAREHGFDGVDLDWEFPGAAERGGKPGDKANFTTLLEEFRAEMHAEAKRSGKPELLLTIAAPAGPYFLRGYELDKLHAPLDWINVMTYDYHGEWEAQTGSNSPMDGAELSIQKTIEIYLEEGVPPQKLVMGFATYARSWTEIEGTSPGSKAKGVSVVGPCGKESLGAHQVAAWVAEGKYKRGWDEVARTPYAFSEENKAFITYDDAESYKIKLDFLASQDLGGAMFWAIDLDDFKGGYPLISQVSNFVLPSNPTPVTPAKPAPVTPAAAAPPASASAPARGTAAAKTVPTR